MAALKILDYTDYLDLLPTQYANSPNLIAMLQIFLDKVQELNEAQQDLNRVSTDIDLAEDHQLDLIGTLLGAERGSRSDVEYRKYIRFIIVVNSGSGTAEDLIVFLKGVTSATKVRMWEHYPAALILETDGDEINLEIARQVDSVSMGGVVTEGVVHAYAEIMFRPPEYDVAFGNFSDGVYQHVEDTDSLVFGILPELNDVLGMQNRAKFSDYYPNK